MRESTPAETPAAAPAASSMRCLRRLKLLGVMTAAVLAPSSTDGASGPRDAPLPSVRALANALRATYDSVQTLFQRWGPEVYMLMNVA